MGKRGLQIGVDLGTANTLVYIGGYGIIYNEPSVVAFDRQTKEIVAVGMKAKMMLGKEHDKIKVVKPLERGVIADLDATKANLEFVFKHMEHIDFDYKKSTLLICIPNQVTQIERMALKELAEKLGFRDVFVESEVKAGAIGAGIDIFAPRGSMVVDIGGGTTDIGVLSLGDVVVSDSIRIAGNYFDEQIVKYVKQRYRIHIGNKTAEQIKIHLGTLRSELNEPKEYTFAGRHINTGVPTRGTIKQEEIRNIFLQAFESITLRVINVLQNTPPELASDIYEDGLVVNGGGALIDGVQEYFKERIGIEVRISDNPLTSIVEGTKFLLRNRGNYLVKPID